jgi:hypothetical protein
VVLIFDAVADAAIGVVASVAALVVIVWLWAGLSVGRPRRRGCPSPIRSHRAAIGSNVRAAGRRFHRFGLPVAAAALRMLA